MKLYKEIAPGICKKIRPAEQKLVSSEENPHMICIKGIYETPVILDAESDCYYFPKMPSRKTNFYALRRGVQDKLVREKLDKVLTYAMKHGDDSKIVKFNRETKNELWTEIISTNKVDDILDPSVKHLYEWINKNSSL